MGKFSSSNVHQRSLEGREDRTENYEGAVAYSLDPLTELYQRVATCLVAEPKFYDTEGKDTDNAILSLVQQVSKTDPEFILKLAVYARKKLLLRSVPIMLLGEAVLHKETRSYVKAYTPLIISRADELREIIGYLQVKMGDFGNHAKTGMLPASIKKGLADVFGKFDEYQLQKYETRDEGVKLRDVIKLVHPKPASEEQSALWKRLVKGEMAVADTWETIISTYGSTKENWEMAEKVMPIMAMLRNLRNMLDKEVSIDTIKSVAGKLSNKDIILKSKQFPFRFLSAYKSIQNHSNPAVKQLMSALETAMDISCANLPHFEGTTAIFADISGSMDFPISAKSTVMAKDIACLLLAIADRICDNSITAVFSDHVWQVNLNPRNGVLTNMLEARSRGNSSATYTHLCLDQLKTKVDRVLLLTDQQDYSEDGSGRGQLATSLHAYRQRVGNPNVFLYSIDLRGYGTTAIPQSDPHASIIAGWTDRMLEYVNIFETSKTDAVAEINNSNYISHNTKSG